MDSLPNLYPLTSLQIGDIQSYLSQVFLYFAEDSCKFLILVDNQSWLTKKYSKSTHLWQLMVTKYRMSPFTNTRTLSRTPSLEKNSSYLKSSCYEKKNLHRWFSVIKAAQWSEKPLFTLMDLCKVLHGFIVFEVAWKDVHGINYINELQTDTSLALEVKVMKKWEFSSINQALNCTSSWFSGTQSEIKLLQSNLNCLCDEVSPSRCCPGFFVASKGLLIHDDPEIKFLSADMFFDVKQSPVENNQADYSQSWKDECWLKDRFSIDHQIEHRRAETKELDQEEEFDIASTQQTDALLLFRFSDRDLPSKLRQIITFDLRLLSLLESGLPSWVIFLQSYPLFCHVYWPWMRPIAKSFYFMISLITVIIGFYDLYKNIPLLKATASHLCGPLFKWIEAWEMISRIRYLGTMLFLQNFEKAVRWFLVVVRVIRLFLSLTIKPFMNPLAEVIDLVSPIWSIFTQSGILFSSTAWVMVQSSCSMVLDLVMVLVFPFELLYSYIFSTVILVYPIFCSIWELVLVPIRFSQMFANYSASLFSDIYDSLKGVLISVSSMVQLTYLAQTKASSTEIPIWHSVWKDLFSKIFRSLRSIVHGLVEFFTSCSRHRLSIYNHMRVLFWQLSHLLHFVPYGCSCQQTTQMETLPKVDSRECNCCNDLMQDKLYT